MGDILMTKLLILMIIAIFIVNIMACLIVASNCDDAMEKEHMKNKKENDK